MKEKISKSGLIFISLAAPVGLLVGTLTALILKIHNPSNVDITAEIAYLRPSLYAGYGSLAVLLVLGCISSVISYKNGRKNLSKATFVTLAIVIFCVAGAAIAQQQVTKVEASYTKSQLQDLYKQFNFKK